MEQIEKMTFGSIALLNSFPKYDDMFVSCFFLSENKRADETAQKHNDFRIYEGKDGTEWILKLPTLHLVVLLPSVKSPKRVWFLSMTELQELY